PGRSAHHTLDSAGGDGVSLHEVWSPDPPPGTAPSSLSATGSYRDWLIVTSQARGTRRRPQRVRSGNAADVFTRMWRAPGRPDDLDRRPGAPEMVDFGDGSVTQDLPAAGRLLTPPPSPPRPRNRSRAEQPGTGNPRSDRGRASARRWQSGLHSAHC